MPKGGHANAGRRSDPDSLRSAKLGGSGWVTLPVEGFSGGAPNLDLPNASKREVVLWESLWRKPQAAMWAKLGMELEVAAYVRAYVESTEVDASAGLKTAVLRMSAELGLSLPGMQHLRWRFAEDEVAASREEKAAVPVEGAKSARERLRALNDR